MIQGLPYTYCDLKYISTTTIEECINKCLVGVHLRSLTVTILYVQVSGGNMIYTQGDGETCWCTNGATTDYVQSSSYELCALQQGNK